MKQNPFGFQCAFFEMKKIRSGSLISKNAGTEELSSESRTVNSILIKATFSSTSLVVVEAVVVLKHLLPEYS